MKDMQENEKAIPAPVHPFVMRLEAMRDMEHNWDSYGAVAPNQQAIDRAIVFVREILESEPHLCPTVNGNIVFEGNGGTSIEIGASPDDDEIWIDGDA